MLKEPAVKNLREKFISLIRKEWKWLLTWTMCLVASFTGIWILVLTCTDPNRQIAQTKNLQEPQIEVRINLMADDKHFLEGRIDVTNEGTATAINFRLTSKLLEYDPASDTVKELTFEYHRCEWTIDTLPPVQRKSIKPYGGCYGAFGVNIEQPERYSLVFNWRCQRDFDLKLLTGRRRYLLAPDATWLHESDALFTQG